MLVMMRAYRSLVHSTPASWSHVLGQAAVRSPTMRRKVSCIESDESQQCALDPARHSSSSGTLLLGGREEGVRGSG
jgi:hypothetical protein